MTHCWDPGGYAGGGGRAASLVAKIDAEVTKAKNDIDAERA
jgi:hypothetical protein